MEKKFCIVFYIVIVCFSFCIIQAIENNLQPHNQHYNQKKRYIIVKNLIIGNRLSISYNNTTTIFDVTKELENSEGIAIDKQKLIAVIPWVDQDFTHYKELKIGNFPM